MLHRIRRDGLGRLLGDCREHLVQVLRLRRQNESNGSIPERVSDAVLDDAVAAELDLAHDALELREADALIKPYLVDPSIGPPLVVLRGPEAAVIHLATRARMLRVIRHYYPRVVDQDY